MYCLPQQPNRRSDHHHQSNKRGQIDSNVSHTHTHKSFTIRNWPAWPSWCLCLPLLGWRGPCSSRRRRAPSAGCPGRGAGPYPTSGWRPRSSGRSGGRPETSGPAGGAPHRTRSSTGQPGAAVTRVLTSQEENRSQSRFFNETLKKSQIISDIFTAVSRFLWEGRG